MSRGQNEKARVVDILRRCRADALATAAALERFGWSKGFEAGRAHGFRFALSLLDPAGPEAAEIELSLSRPCSKESTA